MGGPKIDFGRSFEAGFLYKYEYDFSDYYSMEITLKTNLETDYAEHSWRR